MSLKSPYTDAQVQRRIDDCPKLASLRSINNALSELVHAEQSFTSQIAEIIRRDPTLTTRLLKLVNSVFFGLSKRVTNIEDAIFYLGLKQIRELALATPVIEDFSRLNKNNSVDWKLLWQHSIGAAIMTREVSCVAQLKFKDDTDYIAGLVHNVGQIVFASVFPEQFEAIYDEPHDSMEEQCEAEQQLIGWDHARIGAYYLQRHQLSEDVVDAVCYHHNPEAAEVSVELSAAVQVAEYMVRSTGVFGIDYVEPAEEGQWVELPGWSVLMDKLHPVDLESGMVSIQHTLARLPAVLGGLV